LKQWEAFDLKEHHRGNERKWMKIVPSAEPVYRAAKTRDFAH